MKIERIYSATRVNEVVNHPDVYPWVHGTIVGPLDLTPLAEDRRNVILWGEQGGIAFLMVQPGIYEAHAQALPEGRGRWMLDFTWAALHWMFTKTDAMEVVTRVPRGNFGARALAKAVGFTKEFSRPDGWVYDHRPVPVEVWSLQLQGWMKSAPNLVEEGIRFHNELGAEYIRMGKIDPIHPDDDNHDRYVGAAVAMVKGGQPFKALVFYNRWAKLAGYKEISLLKAEPVIIDIQESILMFKNDTMRVMACQSQPG